jgi:hypothetical protein
MNFSSWCQGLFISGASWSAVLAAVAEGREIEARIFAKASAEMFVSLLRQKNQAKQGLTSGGGSCDTIRALCAAWNTLR